MEQHAEASARGKVSPPFYVWALDITVRVVAAVWVRVRQEEMEEALDEIRRAQAELDQIQRKVRARHGITTAVVAAAVADTSI